MAALDLTAPTILPTAGLVTLGTAAAPTTAQLRRVNLPTSHGGLFILLRAVTTDAKYLTLATDVADNTAIGSAGYGLLPAGVEKPVYIPSGTHTLYLASETASQVVSYELNRNPYRDGG
jgi:hypothetical protein